MPIGGSMPLKNMNTQNKKNMYSFVEYAHRWENVPEKYRYIK